MNTTQEHAQVDDYDIADLLHRTGYRHEPLPKMRAEIEAAVRADWHEVVRAHRKQRHRLLSWSVAASFVVIACASLLTFKVMHPAATAVATLAHIDGRVIASSSDGPTPSIAIGEAILIGESLRTGANSRAALRWPSGLSVRLDHDTAIRIDSGTRIVLIRGSVYVDAAPDHAEPVSIQSPLGTVRHLGTQYVVSARPDALEVSVREGRVAIDHNAVALVGVAGERISVNASGAVERTALAAADASWNWATAAGPTFQIDNQTLAAFLNWMARETGRRLIFESPQARIAAARVILRGSIDGLDLDTALAAVLSTTKLHRSDTKDDSIAIALNRD